MKKKPILLIVDDVLANVKILSAILEEDYELKTTISAKEAVKLSREKPYADLIILDVKMPELDGYMVLKELQDNPITKDTPVIFVTGSDTVEDEEKGFRLGAVDYITKPIHPSIVKARVNTHIILKKQRDQLLYNASFDQLTGLYNRHVLAQEGKRKFARAKRQNDILSVIILDIDHFKRVNDNYGHLCGDKVLVEIARVLNDDKRTEDFTARFGGEEFIVILESCSMADAKIKAESLRKAIENLNIDEMKVTSSFGIATLSSTHKNIEELIRDADKALYKAKENGRNRVEIFEEKILKDV